ncbi:MAG TPA: RbsD/FucU domain-containing protein [Acidobacteriaceae bacterium]|jgi:hypothetical protein|nr:RbsD/FucU domain-containing protein [Acidobacteriaceae bacterium]
MEKPERAAERFGEALEPTGEERQVYLDRACQGQPTLRSRVESLLEEHDHLEGFLGESPFRASTGPGESAPSGSRTAATRSGSAEPLVTPGSQLGPYRIEARLGEGGMGQIFRATDTRLGRPVAIKICNQEFMDRFEQERRSIAAINHPRVCTFELASESTLIQEQRERWCMKKNRAYWATALAVAMAAGCVCRARAETPAEGSAGWQATLHETLPLLGHRNWILVVDSAYPLQNSPGIETIETGASEAEVLRDVLEAVDHSIHVRPVVYMDAELPFVPEQDAPGVSQARSELTGILGKRPVTRLLHEQLLQKVEDVSKSYKVLILKTNETVPYTSVFVQLNCRYWSDEAEARLRVAMQQAGGRSH